MSDHEKYSSPDEEMIEALFGLVYENDADSVAEFLDRHRIPANIHLPLGDMPLLHAAVDAETEAAIHDPLYVPTIEGFECCSCGAVTSQSNTSAELQRRLRVRKVSV